ncbi:MAG TPA: hypothetical protein VE973_02315 [Candidatus Limnocylindria bacterium]|nr:hypothetical protein [Candidatus Limnocylindria bacterium]
MSRNLESGINGQIEKSFSKKVDYEVLTNPEQRAMLFSRVRDLVDKTLNNDYKAVIFLDKSARPISYLYRKIWEKENGQTQKIPEIAFLNVGTETFSFPKFPSKGKYKGEEDYYDAYEAYMLEQEETAFAEKTKPQNIDALRKGYSNLSKLPEGSKILIVDELSISGNSLEKSQEIMNLVFPELEFDTHALSTASLDRNSKKDELFYNKNQEIFAAPWADLQIVEENGKEVRKDRSGYTGVANSTDLIAAALPKDNSPKTRELKRRANQLREELDGVIEEGYA